MLGELCSACVGVVEFVDAGLLDLDDVLALREIVDEWARPVETITVRDGLL